MAAGIALNLKKEQLEQLCNEGLSINEIAAKLGIGWRSIVRYLKKFGLKTKHTQTDRYHKKMSELASAKMVDPEARAKIANTCKITFNTDEMRSKISAYSKISGARQDLKELRSVISKELWQNPAYRESITRYYRDPAFIEMKRQRGLALAQDPEWLKKAAAGRIGMRSTFTKPHIKVCEILKSLSIEYINEYDKIAPYSFDIFIPEHKMLVEVQGDYWHSLPRSVRNDKAKSTYIERYFPEYKLKYVWEHECLELGKVEAKIKYWLGFKDVNVVEYNLDSVLVDTIDNTLANSFLYNWHYQRHGRSGLDIGGSINGELICVARFVSPSRQEIATSMEYRFGEVLELSRLCVHPKYQKKNLLSWFLARCEKLLPALKPKIKCLVSFADATFNHTGAVYKASNWKQHSVVNPDYWYTATDGFVMHKKTLWNHANSLKMSEKEFAEKYGYTKVYGYEKYKFIKEI